MEPLISIIIPTYNRPDFLERISIPSVIDQAYKNWELWIVDDGSIDDVKSVVERFQKDHPNIFYLRQENRGQGAARNNGIRNVRGDWVILLDSDDALLPKMVDRLMGVAQRENAEIVGCRSWVMDLSRGSLLRVQGPNPSCILYKKDLFYRYGFYNESREFIGIEDTDLFILWEVSGIRYAIRQVNLSDPLVIYGFHKGQATTYIPEKHIIKTRTLANKWSNIKNAPSWFLSEQFFYLANFSMLLGKKDDAQGFFKKALAYNPKNLSVKILFRISFLSISVYKRVVNIIKFLRAVLWRTEIVVVMAKYYDSYRSLKERRAKILGK